MVQTSKVSLIKGGWLINGLDFDLFLCLFNISFSLWSINLFLKKWSTSVNSVYKLHTELNILKLMSGFGFDEDALDFGLFIFHFIPLLSFFFLPQSISKLCYCLFLSLSLSLSLSFSPESMRVIFEKKYFQIINIRPWEPIYQVTCWLRYSKWMESVLIYLMISQIYIRNSHSCLFEI